MCCNFNLPDTLSFFMIFPALNTRFCVLILSLNLSCLSGTAFTRTHDWLYFVSRHACMHACMHTCIHTYVWYIHTYVHTDIHTYVKEVARLEKWRGIVGALAAPPKASGPGLRLVVSLKVLSLSACFSIYLSICLSACQACGLWFLWRYWYWLSVCLFVCLSVKASQSVKASWFFWNKLKW